MVWISENGHVVGPHFFDGHLTADRYNNFLQNELPVLLENVDLHTKQHLWFQQDGTPAHSARAVRRTLNNVFRNGWLGIGGTVEFPSRSPDLTALDLFLWGYLKNIIYQVESTTAEDMKRRIVETCRNISALTFQRVENSFRNRVNLCIEANGQAFEHLLA
ncbi:hypothetical protein X777_09997 [Ooceraea biroi]|uniref:Tc1-like transposase DDE domain-containing protein n=1 Tax=Ooceraea biroi TaxID=2015173 RepID=A0A026W5L7_OOCBI|nr:hypothetical protein X777_09997 [Ooceraea biroi]